MDNKNYKKVTGQDIEEMYKTISKIILNKQDNKPEKENKK